MQQKVLSAVAPEEALKIHYVCCCAGQHGAAAGYRCSDGIWWEPGGHPFFLTLFSAPIAVFPALFSSTTLVSPLGRRRTWLLANSLPKGMPGPCLDFWQFIISTLICRPALLRPALFPLLPFTALSGFAGFPVIKLPCPLPNPRPKCQDSQVMVSRRSMQHMKSEKPILLVTSPKRRDTRCRICSLMARPVEQRGMTTLGTHCRMTGWPYWSCAPFKEAVASPQSSHPARLVLLWVPARHLAFPPGLGTRFGVEWWKIKALLVTHSNCGAGQQARNTAKYSRFSYFAMLAFIFC